MTVHTDLDQLAVLASLADDEARGLRFVAEHNRKKGEAVYATRTLDRVADVLERAAAAIDALQHDLAMERRNRHIEWEAHQVTKTELAAALSRIPETER